LANPAIECVNVSYHYGNVEVLKNVTFTVEENEFLGILGPNGGGKTTLLKLLLGLFRPSRGHIKIFTRPPAQARHLVGYLPQEKEYRMNFPIKVFDVAIMGRISRTGIGKPYSAEDRKKTQEVLEMVEMWEYRSHLIQHLSGGQRQRVFIARALAAEPSLLLLDEPFSGLDPDFEIHLYDLLKELNAHMTIVVVTHDIGVISRYVKSVACINRHFIYHAGPEITPEMIEMTYQCPVDLIAHGMPHRVFESHEEK